MEGGGPTTNMQKIGQLLVQGGNGVDKGEAVRWFKCCWLVVSLHQQNEFLVSCQAAIIHCAAMQYTASRC